MQIIVLSRIEHFSVSSIAAIKVFRYYASPLALLSQPSVSRTINFVANELINVILYALCTQVPRGSLAQDWKSRFLPRERSPLQTVTLKKNEIQVKKRRNVARWANSRCDGEVLAAEQV